jgi:hypothetical protein
LNLNQLNYNIFFLATTAFILVGLVMRTAKRGRANQPLWWPILFSAVLLAASWWATTAPGRSFPHYLLLTVFPACLFCGTLMADPTRSGAVSATESAPRGRSRVSWGTWFGAACLVVPLTFFCFRPLFHESHDYYFTLDRAVGNVVEGERTLLPPRSSVQINRDKKPGDRLTVWGWRADYHVETQLPMGTRSACPENQIRNVPLRDYFRRTALEEFKRTRPAFFIDASGPLSHEFTSRARHGHETFPELAAFVRENYTLSRDSTEDRLYIRNDRFREIPAGQPAPGVKQPTP